MDKDIEIEVDEVADNQRQANIAAEFAGSFLMHRHRGVIDCGDQFVIYGNDGYSIDARSRREAELVVEELADGNPVLGISDEGYTWAVVVTDYQRPTFDPERLNKMVWNAWMLACDEIENKEAE
jgi:hypothetical protein